MSKKVFCRVGRTVFNLLKARPSRPEHAGLSLNDRDTFLAFSTAMFFTLRPPIVTVSVQTSPLEVLPSPYWMLQDAPESFFADVLLPGL